MMILSEGVRLLSARAGTAATQVLPAIPAGLTSGGTVVLCGVFLTMVIGVSVLKCLYLAKALDSLRAVTRTLQEGILRPLPGRVGGLRTEVRYLAAEPGAQVGGDIYDVISTPYGVRVLIGDVMGSGMPAVATAVDALGAFRELVRCEARLTMVAQRMDASLAGRPNSEDFVTALLLGLHPDDGRAELICCGHPPPLLIRDGRATFVDALPPSPPLGLFGLQDEWCRASSVRLTTGDRLLLYTDGITEARDGRGAFYPLAERTVTLYDEDPGVFLDRIAADVARHTQGRTKDDAALLLVDYGDIRARDGQLRSPSPEFIRDIAITPMRNTRPLRQPPPPLPK
ncbi:PP2C family protein-serine/threonine phosphatase [Streptomyces sp. BH105]|uniref:PP2C family protein-serine/threonine phosphatase n=1 Tax=Streptomyces sp. BH105 TaxID=3410408 RepID=UPI003CF59FF5